MLALLLGRYAEVTAPALYGRPVNLYWDAQHLPKVAAMLAEVGPWWLVGLLVLGIVALLAALIGRRRVVRRRGRARRCDSTAGRRGVGARRRRARRAVRARPLARLARAAQYSLPVTPTYLQQARFVVAAWTADPNRDLPGVPLPPSDLGRLGGDDVLLMFLESYGAVTYDEPAIARIVAPARDELAHAAAETAGTSSRRTRRRRRSAAARGSRTRAS